MEEQPGENSSFYVISLTRLVSIVAVSSVGGLYVVPHVEPGIYPVSDASTSSSMPNCHQVLIDSLINSYSSAYALSPFNTEKLHPV